MLAYLLKKEFRQLRRNPFLPRMIVMFPFMVLMIFPWAASYEIKNLNLSVVDRDHSAYSRQLIQTIVSSGYFRLTDYSNSYKEALKSIESDKADIIIEIPEKFESKIVRLEGAKLFVASNAVNGMKGSVAMTYVVRIVNEFTASIMSASGAQAMSNGQQIISIEPQYRFNRQLNYQVFMVPALMVMILTMLCGFLPGVSIVLEKELGTMEQINVSPVSKLTFIVAKLIPFWIIGFIVITIGFLVAWGAYGLIPAGHFLTIYAFAAVYILGVSGMGLIISNYAQTMQQAMFVVFFFMMIFIMLSGLYTPVDSMPDWAQWIAAFDPLKYMMEVMRYVYLKGSHAGQLLHQLLVLTVFMLVFNVWAILSYRKSS